MMRRLRFAVLVCGALLVAAFLARRPLMTSLGDWLVDVDPVAPADVAVAMAETGPAGQIELADLLNHGVVSRVAVMQPEPDPAITELEKRGVAVDSPARVLFALGVPASAVTIIPAGEGGTTDGTEALADWTRAEKVTTLIVVTGADHSHRVRRALRRAFGQNPPRLVLHVPAVDTFHAESWWQHRRTLRTGLVELEKLLLDVARRPWS